MQTFYQYTTGIGLLSVAVSVSIYRDTYRTYHIACIAIYIVYDDSRIVPVLASAASYIVIVARSVVGCLTATCMCKHAACKHKHVACTHTCMQKGGYAHASTQHACASMRRARKKVPNACLRMLGQLSQQQACSMLARACCMHAKRFQMHVCRMLAKKYTECMPHACETCLPLWFGPCVRA